MVATGFKKVLQIHNMHMYPLETRDKARKMAEEGKSIPQISEELDVLYNTVRVWVRGHCKLNRRSQETVDKALELIRQGHTKMETARILGVPVNTLYKWNLPPARKYTEETKQKAREMVLRGVSKVLTAFRLGVSPRAVCNWTADIPRNMIPYPLSLKKKARNLVRRGMTKTEVAEKLGLGYSTAIRWTTDIKQDKSAVSGRYFLILCRLVKDGYVIADRKEVAVYKTIMKWAPLKSIIIGRTAVYYVDNNKKGDAEAALKKLIQGAGKPKGEGI